jgi:o-succinylbenzoate synthase
MFSTKVISHPLHFIQPAGTSRGVLLDKPTWFLVIQHQLTRSIGIGECSLIPGLSMDNENETEKKLKEVASRIAQNDIPNIEELVEFPAIQFALETALQDAAYEDDFSPYPGDFSKGKKNIPINGLIWMGNEEFMRTQIQQKLDDGFSCIKMKIGAIDFDTELKILASIRNQFSPEHIELRVDANGAFSPEEALSKLEKLSKFHIHSIEQPIAVDQWKEMAVLAANSPIPIALDEELIGMSDLGLQIQMLQFIQPQYLILKPSLLGGMAASEQWISVAEKLGIGWWATSALESNVGLNAIAQWVSHQKTTMPQGLGTGKLFTNNIDSPLEISNGTLLYSQQKTWNNSLFR